MRLPFPPRQAARRRPPATLSIREAREKAWLDLQRSRNFTA